MDIFLDTEFIGFKSLQPLSVGLCPLNAKLPSAYFELEIDQPDISRLDEEDQFFMTTEVLCQLGISEQLRALELIGVRTLRSNFSELEGAIYKYLKACSEVAACTKEKIWLISDYCIFWPNWTAILAETGHGFWLKLDSFFNRPRGCSH
jgi:hypothetical protein